MEQTGVATDPTLDQLLQELAKSNHFTMEELAENRAGRMSKRQRGRFKRWTIQYFSIIALVEGVYLALFVAEIVGPPGRAPLVEIGVFGLLQLLYGVLVVKYFLPLVRDLHAGSAAGAEGRGGRFRRGSSSVARHRRYYYVFDGKSLIVGADAYWALARGVYYRAYYAPNCNYLLSIEPLRRVERHQMVASQGEQSYGTTQE